MEIKLFKFKSVKSTNDIAINLIKKKKIQSAMISSQIQTKGRGTMGKKWVSQKGNIFISIYFKIDHKKINFKQYAILNAYLMKHVISKFILKKIRIKWPNDLMYNKNKVCGILQEVVKINKKNFLIVGIGLNTNKDPKDKFFLSISLKDIIKKNINNEILLKKIKNKYEKFLDKIDKYSYLELKEMYK
tara:strand:+ start:614 stop:1177 length:564 start_codon:yes stop_codon:yes gene_type:complete